jgi:hypothetical protein
MEPSTQKGNALFLILIAVALFAALSYAVTQSGRGSGNIDRETKVLETSQMYQYLSQIRAEVQRMVLIKGCSDTDITFYNAPAKPECGIFSPEGGNMPVSRIPYCCGVVYPPFDHYDIPQTNNTCGGDADFGNISMQKLWIKGVGEDYKQDLIMVVCDVPEGVCDQLDLPSDPTAGYQIGAFTGSYNTTTSDPNTNQLGFNGNGTSLIGVDMACTNSKDRMYMVVLAR